MPPVPRSPVLVLAALLGCVLLPASARAAATPVATGDGATLRAQASGASLCLSFTDSGSACSSTPLGAFSPVLIAPAPDGPVGGAVPPGVAAVELETAAGRRRVATVAAPGFRSRFFVAVPGAAVSLVRLYDAGGTLVGVAEPEYWDGSRPPGRVLLRAGRAAVRVRAEAVLEPRILTFEHRTPRVCVTGGIDGGGSDLCAVAPVGPRELAATGAPGCGSVPGVVFGTAGPEVAAVRLRLGDGRTRRAATVALPEAPPEVPVRGVAIAVPRREAVRTAVGLDAGGHVVAHATVAGAPGAAHCDQDAGAASALLDPAPAPSTPVGPTVAVAHAGGHALRVADGTDPESLCAALDSARPTCGPPTPDVTRAALGRGGRAVFGVLPAAVARVDVRLASGRVRRVRTVAGAAYTGPLAGHVRFVLTRVPAGAIVAGARLRDAAGRLLASVPVGAATHRGPVRPLARRGELRLGVRARSGGFLPAGRRVGCAAVRLGRLRLGDVGACAGEGVAGLSASVEVLCSPRRTVAVGVLPRRATGVAAELTGGDGRWSAVVARIPPGLGGGRFYAIAASGRGALRAIRFAGVRRSLPVGLPPANRQCGYVAAAFGR